MKTIAAMTDFSERSTLALERARAIAAASSAEILVVHAIDDGLPRDILERRVAEAEDLLRRQAGASGTPGLRWEVAIGDTFWALHRAATNARADLIVAGNHRRRPLRDLIRDTTVERLIRVSALPVLIARTPVTASYRHALVAIESEEGDELVGVLADFGTARPAGATLLHAISAPAEGLMHYAGVQREDREDYRANIMREARTRLIASVRESPIPTEIKIVDSPPAEAIARFVEESGCDLVAVSSHARRAPVRGILGSISSELIRYGTTDLLIVPRIVSGRRLP